MSEHEASIHSESVGTVLARTRRQYGLTLEDVSEALKLTSARVAALEADQFSAVGAAIFVRGFVRSYAKLLELPERQFDAQLQRYFDQLEPELVPSHGTRRSVSWGERYSWAFSYLVGTALVLTLIWTVIGFDSDSQKRSSALIEEQATPNAEPSPEQIAATAGESDPVFSTGLESEVLIVTPDYAPTINVSRDAQTPVLASLTPFSVDQAPAESGFTLTLSGQSWTEVLDAAGKRVAYGTLNVGAHRIDGQPPFVVLLGNASAAQLSAAGQAIDVSPFMRANVARFKLEASNGLLKPTLVAPR
jgi:cytoskeleton protein RodZ